MDVCMAVKQRLEELGLEQKELAAAAGVTESYISQLLTRKKLPPAPNRTDIYEKMGRFLKLPAGNLSGLAEHQRKEELRRSLDPPAPLHKEVRELILRKCARNREKEVRAIFESHPFGPVERIVTQKLLDVVKRVAKEELESEKWLRLVARLSGRSYQQMRVIILEFLDTDVFHLSVENCVSFLDPLIESWDIDPLTFAVEIVLNRRLAPQDPKRFEFVETEAGQISEEQAGFKQFRRTPSLSGDATEEEIEFLKTLRFKGKCPTALYYYRELQNLRDPLSFQPFPIQKARSKRAGQSQPQGSIAPMQKHREASDFEKQLQLDGKKRATQRWSGRKNGPSTKQKLSRM